jgi:methylated-DNA-[protein]-cysteine S-methyltransferase
MLLFETKIGRCGIEWGDAGVTRVELPSARLRGVERERFGPLPGEIEAAVEAIAELLAEGRRDLRWIAVDGSGCDRFQRAVYAATREVGAGETASYGEIARAIGAPEAAREVGAALGANRVPIVVPCHRVLAADGSLRGFSAPGGIATKRRMLEIEGAPGFAQASLFG